MWPNHITPVTTKLLAMPPTRVCPGAHDASSEPETKRRPRPRLFTNLRRFSKLLRPGIIYAAVELLETYECFVSRVVLKGIEFSGRFCAEEASAVARGMTFPFPPDTEFVHDDRDVTAERPIALPSKTVPVVARVLASVVTNPVTVDGELVSVLSWDEMLSIDPCCDDDTFVAVCVAIIIADNMAGSPGFEQAWAAFEACFPTEEDETTDESTDEDGGDAV